MIKPATVSTAQLYRHGSRVLLQLESKLTATQAEATTGRRSDLGREIGVRFREVAEARQARAKLRSIVETSGLTQSRLSTAQAAMASIESTAQTFLDQALAARSARVAPEIMRTTARASVGSVTDSLNSSMGGVHLFGGTNADAPPLREHYANPPSAGQVAIEGAFVTRFGFPPSDPAAAAITPAQMQDFLATGFAQLFDPVSWAAIWSDAADETMRSRISSSQVIETSASANEAPFRQLMQAMTMVSDLGIGALSDETRRVVFDRAAVLTSTAIAGIGEVRGRLGHAQSRISAELESTGISLDIMARHLSSVEEVDAAEAATRLAELMTQIETAYAITARLHSLSILNEL